MRRVVFQAPAAIKLVADVVSQAAATLARKRSKAPDTGDKAQVFQIPNAVDTIRTYRQNRSYHQSHTDTSADQ
jgi:hypothetical protein